MTLALQMSIEEIERLEKGDRPSWSKPKRETKKKQRLRRTTGHLGIVFSGSRKDGWL